MNLISTESVSSNYTPVVRCLPGSPRVPVLLSLPSSASAARPCCAQSASIVTTDRARASKVRHTFPSTLHRRLYLLQYFPRLSPPPSKPRLGRVLRRPDRIPIVVQADGLTVELLSTTHGLTFARTWTGRNPGLTLHGAPQGLRRRRPRRPSAGLLH